MAFVNLEGPSPHRVILDPFPKSQHRPSLIVPVNPIQPVKTKPVKRWNFRKANWEKFSKLADQAVSSLPPPTRLDLDQAYADFCNLLTKAATNSIDRANPGATLYGPWIVRVQQINPVRALPDVGPASTRHAET